MQPGNFVDKESIQSILIAYGKEKLAFELLDAIIEYGRLLAIKEYRIILERGTILSDTTFGRAIGTLSQQFTRLEQLQALVEILRLMETLLPPAAHTVLTILLDLLQSLLALLLRTRRVGESRIDNFTVCV